VVLVRIVAIVTVRLRCQETTVILSYKLSDRPAQRDDSTDTTPTPPRLLDFYAVGGVRSAAGVRKGRVTLYQASGYPDQGLEEE
jgi:hypothetical protein